MKSEQKFFEESMLMDEYMDTMQTLKEESYAVYDAFHVPEDTRLEVIRNKKLHILAISEDWCGDAMLNNPIMRKIAEATAMEMRVAKRDEDTSLIDRHLTNGGRAIPIYLFLNDANEVVGKWGPRAPELQQYVEEKRNLLPPKDAPHFAQTQKQLYEGITNDYTTNSKFWLYVYESIMKALTN